MHRRTVLVVAPLSLIVALAAACGDDSDGSQADADAETRTVEIDMVDIAFEPDAVDVEAGESVRFVFTNSGDVRHDAFVGDPAAQDAHEAEMRAADDMDDMDDGEAAGNDEMHMDDEDEGIVVEPGDTGELTYTFDEPGETLIGCHEPGHYDAGMVVTVNVS